MIGLCAPGCPVRFLLSTLLGEHGRDRPISMQVQRCKKLYAEIQRGISAPASAELASRALEVFVCLLVRSPRTLRQVSASASVGAKRLPLASSTLEAGDAPLDFGKSFYTSLQLHRNRAVPSLFSWSVSLNISSSVCCVL